MMAKSESGRIVIEVDPALKRELYIALAMSGSTLKDWFVRNAENFCISGNQGSLFLEQFSEDRVVSLKEQPIKNTEFDE